MKKAIALLMIFVLIPSFCLAQEPLTERLKVTFTTGTEEVLLPRGLRFAPQITAKDGTFIENVEWSAKDNDTLIVFASDNMYTIGTGSVNLTGKANGKTYKVKFTVPKVYATESKITIDTPEPVLVGYQINSSGIFTTNYEGKSVEIDGYELTGEEELDPIHRLVSHDLDFYKLTPVKAGTTKIIIKSGSKTLKTITITVEKSAIE